MTNLSTFTLLVAVVALASCDDKRGATAAAAELPSRAPREPESLPSGPVANAYGHALNNLQRPHWDDVRAGKAIFVATWVAPGAGEAERLVRGPASQVREGLGPLFNATSCQGCHFKDGRGRPPPDLRRPAEAHDAAYLAPLGPPRILRVGLVGANGELLADPTYGLQLQDRALPGHRPEGGFTIETTQSKVRYADGTEILLEAPRPVMRALRDEPLHPQAKLSLRLPPSLIGLGLLEAIPEAALVALADPDDQNGDGVSGRVAAGRFGWKASQPTLRAQNAAALREDLGVSTSLHPDDSPAPLAPLELSDEDLEKLTRYVRLLEPPARRDVTAPQVARGEALFTAFGCAGCHAPSLQTGEVADLPELSRRTIAPYTDLLLHDLGDALADDRPEGSATGREWRTAPLWGLGLLGSVTGEVRLLHDGRARSAEEAILWHGGEAQAAREKFRRATAADRAALLRFLDSL